METATSIAISSGLKSRKNELFFMKDIVTELGVLQKLQEVHLTIENTCLVIDGGSLDTVLNSETARDRWF